MRLLTGLLLALLTVSASAQQMTPEQQTASGLGQQIGLLVLKNAEEVARLQKQVMDLANENAKLKKECPAANPPAPSSEKPEESK